MNPTKRKELEELRDDIRDIVILDRNKTAAGRTESIDDLMSLFDHYLQEEVERAKPEIRRVLTRLAEEIRIAYVRWEKDQNYDGEKAEYDLVEAAVKQLTPPQQPVKEKE